MGQGTWYQFGQLQVGTRFYFQRVVGAQQWEKVSSTDASKVADPSQNSSPTSEPVPTRKDCFVGTL